MESNLPRVSENFRRHAGLPERKDDKPVTDSENVSELNVLTEPEGGYSLGEGLETSGEPADPDKPEVKTETMGAELDEKTVEEREKAQEKPAKKTAAKKKGS